MDRFLHLESATTVEKLVLFLYIFGKVFITFIRRRTEINNSEQRKTIHLTPEYSLNPPIHILGQTLFALFARSLSFCAVQYLLAIVLKLRYPQGYQDIT